MPTAQSLRTPSDNSTRSGYWLQLLIPAVVFGWAPLVMADDADHLNQLQTEAVKEKFSPAAFWGTDDSIYSNWYSHSNRLIPVYTFGTRGAGEGIDLTSYTGKNSPYRDEAKLSRIYGHTPTDTLNDAAEYLDQSNIGDIQTAALKAGKKHIFLVVFDGMDWQTTQAAAIYKTGKVGYTSGRGSGLHFQDATAGGTTQFGAMVTTPVAQRAQIDVDQQTADGLAGTFGGYDAKRGGSNPWSQPDDLPYLIGKSSKKAPGKHAVPDSAATATAMTTGSKTYNGSIGVDRTGFQITSIAHAAQQEDYRIGVVTSVPISHATPASAYSHNVTRNDYQDLSRDLLGLPSIAHPDQPLSGVDVLIGAGYGVKTSTDRAQGKNFVPGNRYLTDADWKAVNVENGGKYVVASPQKDKTGKEVLAEAAQKAITDGHRLFGFFGTGYAHLPFQTADGKFNPSPGTTKKQEKYSADEVRSQPTLSEMTETALAVISADDKPFWMLVEAGDVDWANHDNNLDNSIGAVFSGDDAVRTITEWVEKNSSWDESVLIVTADHGHYLHLKKPELLIPKTEK
ncbi:alkaline phosphatase [Thalassoroseus pseudoceratinae]|uniref:alkaline phosphatase n=1 Tax=Thalassoroseus pseudoceratinae TaxID=2713176 RepID=UPI001980C242|nr:alkaline phosphatase [Thalassoroseus pseudoceratinae]